MLGISFPPFRSLSLSSLSFSLLMHDLPLCGMWNWNRCYGNPKPDWSERWGRRGGCVSTRGDLMHCPHTHTHNHAASDQDYKRDSVQGLTYKVMESRAGDIRGRATLTAVNKITMDTAGLGRATKHTHDDKTTNRPIVIHLVCVCVCVSALAKIVFWGAFVMTSCIFLMSMWFLGRIKLSLITLMINLLYGLKFKTIKNGYSVLMLW